MEDNSYSKEIYLRPLESVATFFGFPESPSDRRPDEGHDEYCTTLGDRAWERKTPKAHELGCEA